MLFHSHAYNHKQFIIWNDDVNRIGIPRFKMNQPIKPGFNSQNSFKSNDPHSTRGFSSLIAIQLRAYFLSDLKYSTLPANEEVIQRTACVSTFGQNFRPLVRVEPEGGNVPDSVN